MTAEVLGGDGRIKDRQGIPAYGMGARLLRSSAVGPTGTWFKVPMDAVSYDPYSYADSVNGRLVIRTPGYHDVQAWVAWQGAQQSGARWLSLRHYSAAGVLLLERVNNLAAALAGGEAHSSLILGEPCAVGDYFEVWVYTTINENIVNGALECWLRGVTIGVLPEPWHVIGTAGEPALQGTWVDAGISTPRFRKLPDGNVQMQGAVRSGAVNSTIFTLPVGYRPSTRQDYGVKLWNGSSLVMCTLRVQIDGSVQQGDASATNELWLSVPPWAT